MSLLSSNCLPCSDPCSGAVPFNPCDSYVSGCKASINTNCVMYTGSPLSYQCVPVDNPDTLTNILQCLDNVVGYTSTNTILVTEDYTVQTFDKLLILNREVAGTYTITLDSTSNHRIEIRNLNTSGTIWQFDQSVRTVSNTTTTVLSYNYVVMQYLYNGTSWEWTILINN